MALRCRQVRAGEGSENRANNIPDLKRHYGPKYSEYD